MHVRYFSAAQTGGEFALRRRGVEYGWIKVDGRPDMPNETDAKTSWRNHEAVFLPSILADSVPKFACDIAQARALFEQVLDGARLATLLETGPYHDRLEPDFVLSGTSFEDNDEQAIEKVIFDAWQDDDIVADNLWCKASWLSFDEEDASLRFRFSFGFEGYEDLAADPDRQRWAAKLTDAVFPESRAITENAALNSFLKEILGCENLSFAERIIYFNAPNGGAQMHHDVERGHDGVIFAQMSGSTFWLALSKPRLIEEIAAFLTASPTGNWPKLRQLAENRHTLSAYLEEAEHELAEQLIDRSPAFFRHLIENGYAHVLQPGDVLLMPQYSVVTCVWHSVLCLGDEPGEGLSFAIKRS